MAIHLNHINKVTINLKNLEKIKQVFEDSKKSTNYFVELLKTTKQEKFINTMNIEDIQSEDPELFFNAIFQNFGSHENYFNFYYDNNNCINFFDI